MKPSRAACARCSPAAREQKIEQLAAELGCPSAVFDLDDHTALVRALDGMTAVLHCAGPFSRLRAR